MKFIHLADLHLGKIIYQNNLLDIQIDLLNQVMNYMVQKKIDTLVIAGDVYDRAIASKESIVALNHFLEAMILHYHKKVLIISGNHDSSERLDFASSLAAWLALLKRFPMASVEERPFCKALLYF